ncbi:MAG: hypothetical protein R3E04_12685 [Sphingobium sp.]
MAKEVAAEGVLIRGTLIQAFDASRRQPEVIRAAAVFVGDKRLKHFTIYRSDFDFDQERSGRPVLSCLRPAPFEVGHIYERLVLMPAKGKDPIVNGRWRFSFFGSVVGGKGLELLADEAAKRGRFVSRPPSDPKYGDPVEQAVE